MHFLASLYLYFTLFSCVFKNHICVSIVGSQKFVVSSLGPIKVWECHWTRLDLLSSGLGSFHMIIGVFRRFSVNDIWSLLCRHLLPRQCVGREPLHRVFLIKVVEGRRFWLWEKAWTVYIALELKPSDLFNIGENAGRLVYWFKSRVVQLDEGINLLPIVLFLKVPYVLHVSIELPLHFVVLDVKGWRVPIFD